MQHGSSETTDTVTRRLYEAASDLGRLRRHLNPEPGSHTEWRIDQLAGHIETLLSAHEPTAAEIVAHWAPGDDDVVSAALELVDDRHAKLCRALGYKQAA